jgi:hypothetical protein
MGVHEPRVDGQGAVVLAAERYAYESVSASKGENRGECRVGGNRMAAKKVERKEHSECLKDDVFKVMIFLLRSS